MSVDKLSNILGECFPINPHLSFADLLAHTLTDSMNAYDRTVLFTHDLDDAGSTQN